MPASPSPIAPTEQNVLPRTATHAFSPEELAEYTSSVRLRIKNKDGAIFHNESCAHAEIIVREFLNAASKSVQIFCGKLSSAVYGALLPYFEQAIEREVSIQVVTEAPYSALESRELAEKLKEKGCIRHASKLYKKGSHFLLVDDDMFRLELQAEQKTALACANAKKKNQEVMTSLAEGYAELWRNAAT